MYLRVDYEEALLVAGRVQRGLWRNGLRGPEIVRAARKLGAETKWLRIYSIDLLDEATGIVWMKYDDDSREHCVYLDEGMVIDPAHNPVSRWDLDEWVRFYKAIPVSLLQKVEGE
jgi:hypothetical protein